MIRSSQLGWCRWLLVAVALVCVPSVGARPRQKSRPEEGRLREEKTGTFATREGLRLRLVADLGNVRILTGGPSGQVSYRARIETDSREPEAQELLKKYLLTARTTPTGVELIAQSAPMEAGRRKGHGLHGGLWVNFEVDVPRNYSLDVATNAGNIETQDLDGRAVLATQGGNISAGKLGGPEAAGARLETQGGHITVEDVNGELRASTAGGHIRAANVRGDAVLRSGGGHIRVGSISGTAQLETGGGNITVERAGADLLATTGGGQIDCGEAAGSIKARTGGGGIRILRVTGPTHLETGGGSIFLTQVRGPVRASTGAGTITAWFGGDGKLAKLAGASELESGAGDIIVYIPHELAITIQATVETGGEHRIEADPSLPLKFVFPGGRAVRAECALNGGGEMLRLKTAVGNIRLKFNDPDVQNRMKQQIEQLEQRFQVHQHQQERLEQREKAREKRLKTEEREATRWEAWSWKLEEFWSGAIRVDPDTQQRRLVESVSPVYPDVAKQAGMEGSVRLKAYIGKDGKVESLKVVSGPPALVDAAAEAVRQWRYQPTLVDGKPMNVITTVTVDFRLK
ncbi:MAG TPA: TonB family protein [Candidatus Acidoferrales bacterium]|nr:TonB family protein [Candidatus Acidoferrales bacterium]